MLPVHSWHCTRFGALWNQS